MTPLTLPSVGHASSHDARGVRMRLQTVMMLLAAGCQPPAEVVDRFYGSGAGGALNIASDQSLADLVPDGHLEFTDVTIAAGSSPQFPSGTVIRCTGRFRNE